MFLDIIIDGGGGAGKTICINGFLALIAELFFGGRFSVVKTAHKYKSAKGIHGRALYKNKSTAQDDSLRTTALGLNVHARAKMQAIALQESIMRRLCA